MIPPLVVVYLIGIAVLWYVHIRFTWDSIPEDKQL